MIVCRDVFLLCSGLVESTQLNYQHIDQAFGMDCRSDMHFPLFSEKRNASCFSYFLQIFFIFWPKIVLKNEVKTTRKF